MIYCVVKVIVKENVVEIISLIVGNEGFCLGVINLGNGGSVVDWFL